MNEAHRVLSNRWQRERYDDELRAQGIYQDDVAEVEQEDIPIPDPVAVTLPDEQSDDEAVPPETVLEDESIAASQTEIIETDTAQAEQSDTIEQPAEEATTTLGALLESTSDDVIETQEDAPPAPVKRDNLTYYEVLEVSPSTPDSEILRAYQNKKRRYDAQGIVRTHPLFITLNEAFRVLYNEKSRAEYNQSIQLGDTEVKSTSKASVPKQENRPPTTRELSQQASRSKPSPVSQQRKNRYGSYYDRPAGPPRLKNYGNHIEQPMSLGELYAHYRIYIRIALVIIGAIVALGRGINNNSNSRTNTNYQAPTRDRRIQVFATLTPRITIPAISTTRDNDPSTSTPRPSREPTSVPLDDAALGHRAFEEGNYLGAIIYYTTALMDEESSVAYFLRGLSYANLYRENIYGSRFSELTLNGYRGNALRDFVSAIELTPTDLEPYRERGLFLYFLWQTDNDDEKAQNALDDLTFYANNIDVVENEVQTAIDELSIIVAMIPTNTLTPTITLTPTATATPTGEEIATLITQAENAYEEGDYSQVITNLSIVLQVEPSLELYYLRGQSYRARNNGHPDLLLAIDDFNQVIELDPEFYPAYRERGLARAEFYPLYTSYNAPAYDDLIIYRDNTETVDQEVLDMLATLEERLN